ncbi:protein kinase [Nocardia sp. NPDC101769]|uniref:protein kinase domain-containing protein n=1 Tax=Nocardia sp. NPDC101769 TaxID=3364333 RepID=UPI0038023C05
MTIRPLAPGDPRTIGRYRVLGLLGSGGMGRVLLGIGPDGRLVAIKQVHTHLLGDYEYRARFRREVTTGMRVSGAFTAAVVDFDVDTQNPWLASVFIVGIPLDKAVSEIGPLPVPALATLATDLSAALQDIHRAGLVHRDLKPANVMLTAEGARVIDFGIAHMAGNPSGLTETGTALGSPAYMSPEQASGEPITAASDVFSLGSLLVMAATGSSPFAASSLAYTLFQIVHTEPDLGKVPPEARELIAACLHKDPRSRPTAAQLLQRLGGLPGGTAPWPAKLHVGLRRQAQDLALLTSDPESTLVVGGRTATTLAPGTRPRGKATALRTRLRRIAFATILVLMAVVTGISWARHPSTTTPRPVAIEPMLSRLRNADACAWLKQALTGAVPADSGWPADVSMWQWSPSFDWGCQARSADRSLTVRPGGSAAFGPIGETVDGLPVLGHEDANSPACARGVGLDGTGRGWGIIVESKGMQACGLAQRALERLVATRAAPPRRTETATLAGLDACTLVPRELVDTLVGPIPDQPKPIDAHGCRWDGVATVYVMLHLLGSTDQPIPTDDPIDVGDGLRAFRRDIGASTGSCQLLYPYHDVGDFREAVEVYVQGVEVQREKHCATATSTMHSLIGKLPPLN